MNHPRTTGVSDRSRFTFLAMPGCWAALSLWGILALSPTPAAAADQRAAADAAPAAKEAAALPSLPQPVTSFGAAVVDGRLYVVGGHVGDPHDYSKASVSHGFHRVDIDAPASKWEALPQTRALQGLAAVGHGRYVYRIGGLEPRNKDGEPGDLHSVADVARFDTVSGKWEDCTPLPEPRSSHDAVVVGDEVIVVGGWKMAGKGVEGEWHTTVWAADLTKSPLKWRALTDTPFKRRAMSAAAADKSLVVIGGIEPKGGTTAAVSVLDLDSGKWSQAAPFPSTDRMGGFGSSAFGIGGKVYANGWNTPLLAYDVKADRWSEVDAKLEHRRFFHRLVAHGDSKLLIIGGASKAQQWDSAEIINLAPQKAAAE